VTAMRRVGDLAEQVRGVTYSKDDASDEPRPGYVPVLRAGNIQESRVLFDDLVYVPRERVSREQLLRKHDILIATSSGSLDVVGKAAQVTADVEAGFGAFCKVLRPSNCVHPRYFAHWFSTPAYRRRVSSLAAGANINNLRNEHLDDLEIPVPSFDEQRRVADMLDKADAIRSKRRHAIALTDDLLRSTFLDMFGDPVANPHRWPVSSVSELCEGKQYGTAEKANDEHRGTPVLRMNNLTYTGDIDLKDLKWVELSASELGKLDLRDGDVLFNRVNSRELVGKTSVWQHGDGYTFAGYLIRLRMRRSVATGAYVAAAMNMSSIKRVLFAMAKPSINMANISGTDLDRLLIPVPPIKQQREYDALMRRIMDLRRRGVADAGDELFSSLVARSFPVRLASEGRPC
jgi:type I restriction enzyme S subunit